MNIIKKLSKTLTGTMLALMILGENVANATGLDVGSPKDISAAVNKLQPLVIDMVKPISAIFIFIGIICLGINIIIKRNKPDERTAAMYGLLTIAIGAIILGCAGIIYAFIMSLVA